MSQRVNACIGISLNLDIFDSCSLLFPSLPCQADDSVPSSFLKVFNIPPQWSYSLPFAIKMGNMKSYRGASPAFGLLHAVGP